MMKILLTGKPKSGKSTLLKKIISEIPNKIGLVAHEVLGENGRVGFEVETHAGDKTTIAHIDFKTPHQVSKYFVDVKNLESLIPMVSEFPQDAFLYLDEIGQMQLFSERFKGLVLRYFDSANTCVATLTAVYEDPFIGDLKKRKDVTVLEISPATRDETESTLRTLIGL